MDECVHDFTCDLKLCGSSLIIIIVKALYFSLTMLECAGIYVYVNIKTDMKTHFGHMN